MKESKISKIIMWVANAFFWGLGIMFIYLLLDAFFEEFTKGKSTWVAILYLTIMGGLIMHLYHQFFNSDPHYKNYYKDIFK